MVWESGTSAGAGLGERLTLMFGNRANGKDGQSKAGLRKRPGVQVIHKERQAGMNEIASAWERVSPFLIYHGAFSKSLIVNESGAATFLPQITTRVYYGQLIIYYRVDYPCIQSTSFKDNPERKRMFERVCCPRQNGINS